MGDHMGWGWGLGFFGWLWPLIILALLFVIVWVIVRYISSGTGNKTQKSPLDILNERYARGDISREEYLQKKKDLEA